ncbi:MAG: hypothetical protein RCG15_08450 [Candidatus Rickettsia vulgarisii]
MVIGWIAKDNRHIPFASWVIDPQDKNTSFKARSNALEKLLWLILG